jgi:hypothetical protein
VGEDSVRKTIYIPEGLQRRLERESVIEGVSQTELIRRAVAGYLEVRETAAYEVEKEDERLKERKRLLGSFVVLIEEDDLPEDLARNHDKYLYGDGR